MRHVVKSNAPRRCQIHVQQLANTTDNALVSGHAQQVFTAGVLAIAVTCSVGLRRIAALLVTRHSSPTASLAPWERATPCIPRMKDPHFFPLALLILSGVVMAWQVNKFSLSVFRHDNGLQGRRSRKLLPVCIFELHLHRLNRNCGLTRFFPHVA